jgi:integrase
MKTIAPPVASTHATMQDVLDRLATNVELAEYRKRDLRSAVISFGKLSDRVPSSIMLDLGEIRSILDNPPPSHARLSAKRRANLRSDLTSAIDASGLHPILKTAGIEFDPAWAALLQSAPQLRIRNGLSRLGRWASLRKIAPEAVSEATLRQFSDHLAANTLVRNQRSSVIGAWNLLAATRPELARIQAHAPLNAPTRTPWETLPASFRADVDNYLNWCAVPNALDDDARVRKLAPTTLRLRRDHIHSAVTAVHAAGTNLDGLTSLEILVEPATFKRLLRKFYEADGNKLTAYTHGVAGTLIAVAIEWVKASAPDIAEMKKLRGRLGSLLSGLTDKNKSMLRRFDDPRLLHSLLQLPDKLWRKARRDLAKSKRPFIDLQCALAIDILLHTPLRMKNLAAVNFVDNLHWPQGRGKPAMIRFDESDTKNGLALEYELPAHLADRLWTYRNEIALAVTGERPDAVFVATTGKPRTQAAITVAIEKTIMKNVGIKLTPHQFRHIAAKLALDANPGAFEAVRELLGHKNMKTTTNYYAGVDTRRAGQAHTNLIMSLKEINESPRRRRAKRSFKGD